MSAPATRAHVDRGGTFTDLVLVDALGRARIAKVPSDRAVVGALVEGAEHVTFGTTVATNALLEGRGEPTLLVVTEGFEDLPLIREMARPDLFDPDRDWPPTLATAVVGVPDGATDKILAALDEALGTLDLERFAAAAIVLLHGGEDPAAELLIAQALAVRAPHLYLALGHRVSRDRGYLARLETSLVDAAVTPRLRRALNADRIPSHALAMRSDGGLVPAAELRAHDAVLSGPAGGVLATHAVARLAGIRHAVGLDMGGTSTDVCLVDTAREPPRREGDLEVAGVRLRRAMLEVETIAAGGGSILACDPHVDARPSVGPRSAGADPGPQCYGRGGPPTVTDAALLAGLLDPQAFPFALHPGQVDLPGLDGLLGADLARAWLALTREAMAQAVSRLAMSRGVDLAAHALVAYGGAGAQHACAVAELLGIDTVLVHAAAPVFCAWGQALARRLERASMPLWRPLDAALTAELPGFVAGLLAGLRERFPELADATPEVVLAVRHVGTDFALEIPWHTDVSLAALGTAFDAAHRERYGFSRSLTLELESVTVVLAAAPPEPPRVDADPFGLGAREVAGPRVLHAAGTSLEVPDGWVARQEGPLTRVTRRAHSAPGADASLGLTASLELWSHRFRALAEEAGTTLARLARSVSIRERHDFSCAVFDGHGRLVANAPHIPVHLGAMGETVADLARELDLRELPTHDGDAWLTNDPAAGGSHLPDLTVITLVLSQGQRFFVASRAHHVDVGGLTAGSMPTRSTSLADEGLVFRRAPLLSRGRLVVDLAALVGGPRGSRQPATVAADLEAQLAANAHLARRLSSLAEGLAQAAAPTSLTTWMDRLSAHAEQATRAFIRTLPFDRAHAEDDLDGHRLALTLTREGERLRFDFTGTEGPHPGNLNAPSAVVRAAILYALRVLVGADLPLTDGTLRPIDLVLPTPSLLAPPPGSAVVGGNVETSQRIVDLVFAATGRRAASAGSMVNLVLASPESADGVGHPWAFYETLGGGGGATPERHGPSTRQLHMTNTRATDPEVLAQRLPIRVRRFAIRRDSGGAGRHRGGDGLVRELEVTGPAVASLLAAFRPEGASSLAGAANGAPGRAFIVRQGQAPAPWTGEPTALRPGDRVRLETPGGGGWGRVQTTEPALSITSKDPA
jgi:5-oxoprolinase (ATP-hydrolysing)